MSPVSTLYFPLPDASLDCRPDSRPRVCEIHGFLCFWAWRQICVGLEGCFYLHSLQVPRKLRLDEKRQLQTNTLYIPRCHEGLKSFPMKSFKNLSVSRWQRLCSETSTEQNRTQPWNEVTGRVTKSSPPFPPHPAFWLHGNHSSVWWLYTERRLLILCVLGAGTPKDPGPLNDWSPLWPAQPPDLIRGAVSLVEWASSDALLLASLGCVKLRRVKDGAGHPGSFTPGSDWHLGQGAQAGAWRAGAEGFAFPSLLTLAFAWASAEQLGVSYGDSGCRASALSCLPFRIPSAEGVTGGTFSL